MVTEIAAAYGQQPLAVEATVVELAFWGRLPIVGAILTAFFALCSWLAGQSVAAGWGSQRNALAYGVLVALFHRFLVFALAQGAPASLLGLALSTAAFAGLSWAAWRFTFTGRMASQYPWLYERAGPFSWRDRTPS